MQENSNHNNMETIIIFTNWDSIYECLGGYELSWNPALVQFKVIDINQGKKILVIYDEINNIETITNEIINRIPAPNKVFILFHRKPSDIPNDENRSLKVIQNLSNNLANNNIRCEFVRRSEHPNRNTYGKLISIDQNQTNIEQLEIIFDELKKTLSGDPVLEAKLELLHKCLMPSDAPDNLQIELRNSEKKEKYLEAYKIFISQRDKCPKDEEGKFKDDDTNYGVFSSYYIEALKQLRIALLGS